MRRVRLRRENRNARQRSLSPGGSLATTDEVSLHVHCDFPGEGGHAAFVSGPFPGNLEWLPRRVTAFFEDVLAGRRDTRSPAHANETISVHNGIPK